MINPQKVNDLLYESLETERGGVQIYRTALRFGLVSPRRERGRENHILLHGQRRQQAGELKDESELPVPLVGLLPVG